MRDVVWCVWEWWCGVCEGCGSGGVVCVKDVDSECQLMGHS